jgi:aryl-alcohol dehydrogenase-like predicted oxidoreductase
MEYRFLGASGFKVSALGFGAYYPYWNGQFAERTPSPVVAA